MGTGTPMQQLNMNPLRKLTSGTLSVTPHYVAESLQWYVDGDGGEGTGRVVDKPRDTVNKHVAVAREQSGGVLELQEQRETDLQVTEERNANRTLHGLSAPILNAQGHGRQVDRLGLLGIVRLRRGQRSHGLGMRRRSHVARQLARSLRPSPDHFHRLRLPPEVADGLGLSPQVIRSLDPGLPSQLVRLRFQLVGLRSGWRLLARQRRKDVGLGVERRAFIGRNLVSRSFHLVSRSFHLVSLSDRGHFRRVGVRREERMD